MVVRYIERLFKIKMPLKTSEEEEDLPIFPMTSQGPFIGCVHHTKFHFLVRTDYYIRVSDIIKGHGKQCFRIYKLSDEDETEERKPILQ